MVEEKILVNGKAITLSEYYDMMKKAKEALLAFKESPAYQAELKDKAAAKAQKEKFYQEFVKLGDKLGLSSKALGSIGYKLYLESKETDE
jgi:hypothetical protein